MAKYDFTKVVATDLDGKKLKDVSISKHISNILYHKAKDLDMVDIAMAIHKGEEVELDKSEIQGVMDLLMDVDRSGLATFVRKAIKDYVDSVKDLKAVS